MRIISYIPECFHFTYCRSVPFMQHNCFAVNTTSVSLSKMHHFILLGCTTEIASCCLSDLTKHAYKSTINIATSTLISYVPS